MSFILFNVRVYGIWQQGENILLLREPLGDQIVTKFPGGGLEFGEGTIDCLKREFREELQVEISSATHIYTTDFFIPSALNPEQQVISIYYSVETHNTSMHITDEKIESLWLPLADINETVLTLPGDRKVMEILKRKKH
ncbi:MAG: NUDIX hydrolase [Chitinophagales bacterium]